MFRGSVPNSVHTSRLIYHRIKVPHLFSQSYGTTKGKITGLHKVSELTSPGGTKEKYLKPKGQLVMTNSGDSVFTPESR